MFLSLSLEAGSESFASDVTVTGVECTSFGTFDAALRFCGVRGNCADPDAEAGITVGGTTEDDALVVDEPSCTAAGVECTLRRGSLGPGRLPPECAPPEDGFARRVERLEAEALPDEVPTAAAGASLRPVGT